MPYFNDSIRLPAKPSGIERILLVRTFIPLAAGGPVPPVGLLYIASAIRKRFGNALEIKLFDTGLTKKPVEEFREILLKFKPGVVGFSSMSCEADFLGELAGIAAKQNPRPVIIAGGSHVSAVGEEIFHNLPLDIVVVGEGEETFPKLLDTISRGERPDNIRGVIFRTEEGPVKTLPSKFIRELDKIPFPAWDLVNLEEYSGFRNWNGFIKASPYAPVVTSRGCPYGCKYCHKTHGKKVRGRSAGNVLDEIKLLVNDYGVKEIHFIDDIFNFDEERAIAICTELESLDVSIAFPNGLRADILSEALIDALKDCGTYKIHFGFETASPTLQESIGKKLDIEKALNAVRNTVEKGIVSAGYFMLGFPGETKKEMMKTIDFASSSPLDVAYFFKVTSFPGTDIYKSNPHVAGFVDSKNEDLNFYSTRGTGNSVNDEELNRLIFIAQRKFFFNPRRILRGLRRAPKKLRFLADYVHAAALTLQYYILIKATESSEKKKK